MNTKRITIAAITAICILGVSIPGAMAIHHAASNGNQTTTNQSASPSTRETKNDKGAADKKTDNEDKKSPTGKTTKKKTGSKTSATSNDANNKSSGDASNKTTESKQTQEQNKANSKTAATERNQSGKSCTPGTPAKTHTERRMTSPAHDEQQVVTPARTERVLVTPARTIQHPAVTHVEPVYETQWVDVYRFPDGYVVSGRGPSEEEFMKHGDPGIVSEPRQIQTGTRTVVDKAAWTETIPAQYDTKTIPAVTRTVHVPAQYETVTIVDEPAKPGTCH